MAQSSPQPCGAGSMVHSSMGAPGKGPQHWQHRWARPAGRLRARPAPPLQLSPLPFDSVPQQLPPLPILGSHLQLLFPLPFHISTGRGGWGGAGGLPTSSRLLCCPVLRGLGEGMEPGVGSKLLYRGPVGGRHE